MGGDDAMDHGKAQAGSFMNFFRRVKRKKDLLLRFEGDSRAAVADFKIDKLRFGIGGKRDVATFGHGLDGVDGQVYQHLLQLGRVSLDGGNGIVEVANDGDAVFLTTGFRKEQVFPDEIVQIDRLCFQGHLPAEKHEFFDDFPGVKSPLDDIIQVFLHLFRNVIHFESQLSETENPGQRFIQFVGNPCGQLTDLRQTIGMAELMFQLQPANIKLICQAMLLRRFCSSCKNLSCFRCFPPGREPV